jgi:hypothetical protein
MRWKLYYADLSTFSSEDGEWSDAPSQGVVGLAIPHPDHGRQILSGDAYLLQEGHREPQASDVFGVLAHLIAQGQSPGLPLYRVSAQEMWNAGVKFGHNVDNDDWARLWKWMVKDADTTWPERSARAYGSERSPS